MIPAHLMKLHKILSIMVKEDRITLTDRNSMLAKAGLHYLGASNWQDEKGTIYTLTD
jgi:hypothetical protein